MACHLLWLSISYYNKHFEEFSEAAQAKTIFSICKSLFLGVYREGTIYQSGKGIYRDGTIQISNHVKEFTGKEHYQSGKGIYRDGTMLCV